MVGGDDHSAGSGSQLSEQFGYDGVAKPAEGDGAVGRLVVGQFAHHLRLCAGMAQHVDEVDDEHIQMVGRQLVELLHELVCRRRIVDLVVGEGVVTAETV